MQLGTDELKEEVAAAKDALLISPKAQEMREALERIVAIDGLLVGSMGQDVRRELVEEKKHLGMQVARSVSEMRREQISGGTSPIVAEMAVSGAYQDMRGAVGMPDSAELSC